jgi:glycosyltransferase involved in cell wall biosynthesis
LISVILPTRDSAAVLVPTLAALVPGSAAGIVRDVLIADAGSRDDTEKIADAAGCVFLPGPADLGASLRAAAAAARGNWLLFLEPGSVLEEGWIREVRAFVDSAERSGAAANRAATFRLRLERFGVAPRLAEAAAATRLALIGRPRPEQGLLIAKRFYQALGGHGEGAAPHRRLVGRIGRRIVVLRTGVVPAARSESRAR